MSRLFANSISSISETKKELSASLEHVNLHVCDNVYYDVDRFVDLRDFDDSDFGDRGFDNGAL
jgi:hypothetical protein